MNENHNFPVIRRPHLTKEQRLPKCYKDVEKIIKTVKSCQSNFKTVLANSRLRGCQYKRVYNLSLNVLKYYHYLQTLIDKIEILKKEAFLRREIASILIYEMIYGKGFLPGESKAVTTVQAYQNDIMNMHEELQTNPNTFKLKEIFIPRYVRVHTLLTTVAYVINDLETCGFKQIFYDEDLSEENYLQLVQSLEKRNFLVDFHFKDILVFAQNENLVNLELYKNGHIFLQDKASYIPVHVLNPEPGSTVLDACAAPGMKSAHIASKLKNKGKLIACERDAKRFESLKETLQYGGVKIAKALCTDFKLIDPSDEAYSSVEYILLDPSCSGSGMVNRMDDVTSNEDSKSKERLTKLAGFQIILLKHALKFPSVKRVVYSTCSVHEEENEYVVHEALNAFSDSFKLVPVFPEWSVRGSDNYNYGKLFLRTIPEKHLTNGFFVAMFERIDHCRNSNSSAKYEKFSKKHDIGNDVQDYYNADKNKKLKISGYIKDEKNEEQGYSNHLKLKKHYQKEGPNYDHSEMLQKFKNSDEFKNLYPSKVYSLNDENICLSDKKSKHESYLNSKSNFDVSEGDSNLFASTKTKHKKKKKDNLEEKTFYNSIEMEPSTGSSGVLDISRYPAKDFQNIDQDVENITCNTYAEESKLNTSLQKKHKKKKKERKQSVDFESDVLFLKGMADASVLESVKKSKDLEKSIDPAAELFETVVKKSKLKRHHYSENEHEAVEISSNNHRNVDSTPKTKKVYLGEENSPSVTQSQMNGSGERNDSFVSKRNKKKRMDNFIFHKDVQSECLENKSPIEEKDSFVSVKIRHKRHEKHSDDLEFVSSQLQNLSNESESLNHCIKYSPVELLENSAVNQTEITINIKQYFADKCSSKDSKRKKHKKHATECSMQDLVTDVTCNNLNRAPLDEFCDTDNNVQDVSENNHNESSFSINEKIKKSSKKSKRDKTHNSLKFHNVSSNVSCLESVQDISNGVVLNNEQSVIDFDHDDSTKRKKHKHKKHSKD